MKLVLFMLMLFGVQCENSKLETCETSPIVPGEPTTVLFKLEEDHDVLGSHVYIKQRRFDETDFGTDFVLEYEWNRTLDKMEVIYISDDFQFGGIHNKKLWLLIDEVSAKYEGVYRIETNYYPYGRTCALHCDMRIQSVSLERDGLPVLIATKGHGELLINITTVENPRTFGFLYIGSDTTGYGSFLRDDYLSVECKKTAMATSACTITASGVTEKDAGYYSVTMATSSQPHQDITITFYLQYHQEPFPSEQDAEEAPHNDSEVTISLVVVFIIAVSTAAIIYILRKKMLCTGRSPCFSLDNSEDNEAMTGGGTTHQEQPAGWTSLTSLLPLHHGTV